MKRVNPLFDNAESKEAGKELAHVKETATFPSYKKVVCRHFGKTAHVAQADMANRIVLPVLD